jgi:hypothetical protein
LPGPAAGIQKGNAPAYKGCNNQWFMVKVFKVPIPCKCHEDIAAAEQKNSNK